MNVWRNCLRIVVLLVVIRTYERLPTAIGTSYSNYVLLKLKTLPTVCIEGEIYRPKHSKDFFFFKLKFATIFVVVEHNQERSIAVLSFSVLKTLNSHHQYK